MAGGEVNERRILLKPAEVSELTGISVSKIYSLLAEGWLPAVNIGTSVRVHRAALEELLERSITEPAPSGRPKVIAVPTRPRSRPDSR